MSEERDALRAIDEMLKNLRKPKKLKSRDIAKFYEALEERLDDRMEELEYVLFEEIEDEEKFEKLKKISELLEINIF